MINEGLSFPVKSRFAAMKVHVPRNARTSLTQLGSLLLGELNRLGVDEWQYEGESPIDVRERVRKRRK